MATRAGGISWKIKLTDAFSGEGKKVSDSIAEIRQGWDGLRTAVAGGISSPGLQELADSTKNFTASKNRIEKLATALQNLRNVGPIELDLSGTVRAVENLAAAAGPGIESLRKISRAVSLAATNLTRLQEGLAKPTSFAALDPGATAEKFASSFREIETALTDFEGQIVQAATTWDLLLRRLNNLPVEPAKRLAEITRQLADIQSKANATTAPDTAATSPISADTAISAENLKVAVEGISTTIGTLRTNIVGLLDDWNRFAQAVVGFDPKGLTAAATQLVTLATNLSSVVSGSGSFVDSLNKAATSAGDAARNLQDAVNAAQQYNTALAQANNATTAQRRTLAEIREEAGRRFRQLQEERRIQLELLRLENTKFQNRPAALKGFGVNEKDFGVFTRRFEAEQKILEARRQIAVEQEIANRAGVKTLTLEKLITSALNEQVEARRRIAAVQRERRLEAAGAPTPGGASGGLLDPALLTSSGRLLTLLTRTLGTVQQAVNQLSASLTQGTTALSGLGGATTGAVNALDRFGRAQKRVSAATEFATQAARSSIVTFAKYFVLRLATRSFRDFLHEVIRFRIEVERATVSIAVLFTATQQPRGLADTTSAIERSSNALIRYRENLLIAERFLKRIRRESLTTAATFEELVRAFQVSVAPGRTAGLLDKQILDITVSISRAANALGVAQNQLAEEVRSLLQGTITPRNTRIATALGITNEDIRLFKESGRLFEELSSRLAAFDAVAQETSDTFAVLLPNLKGALQLTLATAALGFTAELKAATKELKESLLVDLGDDIQPSPEAVKAFALFFEGIKTSIQTIREVGRSLGFEGALPILAAVAAILGRINEIARGIAEPLIRGLNIAAAVISGVLELLQRAAQEFQTLGVNQTQFSQVFSILVAIVTVTRAWALGLRTVRAFASPLGQLFGVLRISLIAVAATSAGLGRTIFRIIGPLNLLNSAAALLKVNFLAASFPLLLGGAIIAGIVVAVQQWVKETTGVGLKLSTVVQILTQGVLGSIKFIVAGFRFIGKVALFAFGQISAFFLDKVVATIITGFGKVAEFLNNVPFVKIDLEGIDQAREAIKELATDIEKATDVSFGDLLAETGREFSNTVDETVENIVKSFNNNAQNADISGIFQDPLGFFGIKTKEIAENADRIESIFTRIPRPVSQVNETLTEIGATATHIADSFRLVHGELDSVRRAAGLTNEALEVQNERARAQADLLKRTRDIEIQITNLEKQKQQAILNQDLALTKLTNLKGIERTQAEKVLRLSQDLLQTERKISDLLLERQGQEIKVETAGEIGDVEGGNAAVKRLTEIRTLIPTLQATQATLLQSINEAQASLTQGQIDSITELVEEILTSTDIINQRGQDARDLVAGLQNIRKETFLLEAAQASLVAARKTPEVESRAIEAEAEARAQRLIADATLTQNEATIELARLEAGRIVQLAQHEALLRQSAANLVSIQRLEGEIAIALRDTTLTAEQRARLLEDQRRLSELIVSLEKQRNAEESGRAARLRQTSKELEIQQKILTSNQFGEGLTTGIAQWAQQAPMLFAAGLNLMRQAIDSFSDHVAQQIIDAFNPDAEGTALQRFKKFLAEILKLVIQTLIKIAIAQAILAIFGNGGGEVGVGGGVALAARRGGMIPDAPGYSGGGKIAHRKAGGRPKGVNRHDTTPIWAQPGEIMERVKAVQTYGADLLLGINNLDFDPAALRLAVGLPTSTTQTATGQARPNVVGLAAGGVVPSSSFQTSRTQESDSAPPSREILPVVIANSKTFDQLLANGGIEPLANRMSENRTRFRRALGLS